MWQIRGEQMLLCAFKKLEYFKTHLKHIRCISKYGKYNTGRFQEVIVMKNARNPLPAG